MMRAFKETDYDYSRHVRDEPNGASSVPTAPPSKLATLIAVTLFLAVLIAEAVFLALNAPSVPTSARWPRAPGACRDRADNGTAGPAGRARVQAADIASAPRARLVRHLAASVRYAI